MKPDKVLLIVIISILIASCASSSTVSLAPSPTLPQEPLPSATSIPTGTPNLSPTLPPATTIPLPTHTPTLIPGEPSLRLYADAKQIQIGAYLNSWWFTSDKWRKTIGKEFNLAVIAGGFSWAEVEPVRDQFNFRTGDSQVAMAESYKMAICGHPLFIPTYRGDIPSWVFKGNYSKDELTIILRDYVTQVMTHYKDKISQWIVVEEAYISPNKEDDILYQTFGGYDYIDLVYQAARETDPAAVLIYNDLDNHTAGGETTELTHQIVDRLKNKDLIDGVGLEMRLDGSEPPDKQDVITTMQSYGLPVYVTEIDVNMMDVPGTQEERYELQAKIYRDMLEACLESGVCRSFSVWDISDKYSWLEQVSDKADPTLFDDKLNPKPAFDALLEVLKTH